MDVVSECVFIEGWAWDKVELERRMRETAAQECLTEVRAVGSPMVPNVLLMRLADKYRDAGLQA
jgi:hypothetical protein